MLDSQPPGLLSCHSAVQVRRLKLTARSSYPRLVVPGKFSSWVTKKSTTERVQDWRTGQTLRRVVDCWDVQGRADGVLWAKRFRRAGLARTCKERLDAGYAAGLPFDLRTKQFVDPNGVGLPERDR